MIDALTILNRACARIGAEPLQSVDEETPGGQAAELTYQSVIGFLIGLYPWSWAKELRQLTKLSAVTPLSGFLYAYEMPGDRLGPPLRLTDDATDPDRIFSRYVLSADVLHTDADPVYAEIKFLPAPHRWSATFQEAAVLALAAELALPLADADKLRAELRQDAFGSLAQDFRGGALGQAIKEDARATPPRRAPLGNNPLERAWRS